MPGETHISKWPGIRSLERLEWHLYQSRLLAWAIDHVVHRPRLAAEVGRWERRRTQGSLSRFEARTSSQFGEDGIIAEIVRRVGDGAKYVVEFGIGDGTESNARNLLVHHGWRGLLLEGNPEAAQSAARLYASLTEVRVVHARITVDNILSLFEANDVPLEPDLLSIDTDGNDYWLWERILSRYRPRVVVIEYNGRWVPPREWVMPYDSGHDWAGSAYYGASLTSLAKLGFERGYALVGCTSTGVNAFFVRSDLIADRFPDHANGAAFHYAPPRYGRGYGHPIRMWSHW